MYNNSNGAIVRRPTHCNRLNGEDKRVSQIFAVPLPIRTGDSPLACDQVRAVHCLGALRRIRTSSQPTYPNARRHDSDQRCMFQKCRIPYTTVNKVGATYFSSGADVRRNTEPCSIFLGTAMALNKPQDLCATLYKKSHKVVGWILCRNNSPRLMYTVHGVLGYYRGLVTSPIFHLRN